MLPDFCQPNQETNKLTVVIVPNPVIQKFPLQRRIGWYCIRKQSLFVYRLTRNTFNYTAWAKCRPCFKVKAGGTFINHHAVKD